VLSTDTQDDLAAEAARLDASDPLAGFRERFYLPGADTIYLDGNSLGLLSRDAEASLRQTVDAWRDLAIGGWTDAPDPWFYLPERLASLLAPLVGAAPDEVIATGSTTVNLHQLLATFFDPTEPLRNKILSDAIAFPSDIYAIESQLRLRGLDPRTHLAFVASSDGRTLTDADIATAFTPDVQIAILPSVVYASGQLLDMAGITRAAHKRGIRIGWDCSHSIGALPHSLSAWDADFAFWCHYKYLNAGPGAVGGLYVNRRYHGHLPGLAGWFSSRKDRQFAMSHTLTPAEGAGALQIGTPHILSLAPLIGALGLLAEAGIEPLRRKSLALTAFLRKAIEARLSRYGVTIATPVEDGRRGGHLALVHPEAAALSRALRQAGVIPDYRPPDIIRLAPVALYNTFADCHRAVERLQRLLEYGTHRSQSTATDIIP